MAWFGQGKDTIEWNEFRDDVLFFKWKGTEIKKGSKLIIRPGQNAIFYANGQIEGVFTQSGNYDIETEITPFLSTLKGFFSLRSDTGMRAEVYFVNAKELLVNWGTRQRIMLPSNEVKTGIPVGMNGNMAIAFSDYLTFINKIAGVKETYSLDDISERIVGEINPIITQCILNSQETVQLSSLIGLQANSRSLSKRIADELDKELSEIGFSVRDLNIISVSYPKELEAMAEKMAAHSFVDNVAKYSQISLADSFGKDGGSGAAGAAAQMAMGMEMAKNMMSSEANNVQNNAPNNGDRFCPKCRKMVSGKFCSDCGTETV